MISFKYRKYIFVLVLVLVLVLCYYTRRKSADRLLAEEISKKGYPQGISGSVDDNNELLKKLKTYKQDIGKNSAKLKDLKKLASFKVQSRDGIYSGHCPIGFVKIGEFCFPEDDQE